MKLAEDVSNEEMFAAYLKLGKLADGFPRFVSDTSKWLRIASAVRHFIDQERGANADYKPGGRFYGGPLNWFKACIKEFGRSESPQIPFREPRDQGERDWVNLFERDQSLDEQEEAYFSGQFLKKKPEYASSSLARMNIDNLLGVLDSMTTLVMCGKDPFPKERTTKFVLQPGEFVHLEQDTASLWETVSSTNSTYRKMSAGTLCITNRRLAYISGGRLTSYPFSAIQRFETNWICGYGEIELSVVNKARHIQFRGVDAFAFGVMFHNYYSSDFKEKLEGFLRASEKDYAKRSDFYSEMYSRMRPALSRERNFSESSCSVATSSGCCIPFVLMLGTFVWFASRFMMS